VVPVGPGATMPIMVAQAAAAASAAEPGLVPDADLGWR
jgi:hypothetical protein